jgi:hypothetical protein
MAGMKFFPWWTGPLNLLAWLKNRPYNAKAADLWQPWDLGQAAPGGLSSGRPRRRHGLHRHGRLGMDPP